MTINNNRLIADNGMRLISIDGIIADEVWLSPSDSVDNWCEITEEEAIRIEAEMEAQQNKGVAE